MNFSNTYKNFVQYYNEKDFFKKIKKLSGKLGKGILYQLVVLYLVLSDKKVPYHKRLVIIAALGYFILPTDFIADFIPVFGFTDDVSFLVFALSTVNNHVTEEIKSRANKMVESLVGKKVIEEKNLSNI